MTKRIFITAAGAAAMSMMMGLSAMAADVGATTGPSAKISSGQTAGVSFVERRGGIHDVVMEAGTDPSVLELHFPGAQKITFENVGTLLIVNKDGSLWRYRPEVYQVVDGKRKAKLFGFHFIGKDRVSLRVEKLNTSAPLVVGPVTSEGHPHG